jgi:hypothetical protein
MSMEEGPHAGRHLNPGNILESICLALQTLCERKTPDPLPPPLRM